MHVHIYIYLHTHTQTHTHIHIPDSTVITLWSPCVVEFGDEIGKYMLYKYRKQLIAEEIRDGRAKKYMNKCRWENNRQHNVHPTLFSSYRVSMPLCVCVCVYVCVCVCVCACMCVCSHLLICPNKNE